MKNIIYKLTFCTIAIIAIAFNLTTSANAASPGALDFTFDGDGKKGFTTVAGFTILAVNMTTQDDGKIIVVGQISNDAGIVRFNTDGSLDTTFSGDGVAIVDFGGTDFAGNIAVLSDSKIIVVGGTSSDFAIARLNPNGTLDTTFGTAGKVTTDFFGFLDSGRHLILQSDGKIVVAGDAGISATSNDCGVARYNPNGTLDTTFSTDGKANYDVSSSSNSTSAIAYQSDNKILLGSQSPSNSGDFAVLRLDISGNLDATFGSGGIVTTDVFASDGLFSLAVQANGKILAGGRCNNNSGSSPLALVRYNTNGSLDTTFDGDGRVIINFGSSSNSFLGSSLEIQANQQILVGLELDNGIENLGLAVGRFNSDGSTDTTFGKNGLVQTRATTSMIEITKKIKLLPGGRVLVFSTNFSNLFSLARFNLDIQPTQSGDFDGDGFTDTAVYRPSTGTWFVLRSSDNVVTFNQFGSNGDIPIDGDFDGDGRNDLAVYKPTLGQWWFQRSSDNTVFAAQFGTSTDKPTSGDYDKDGKTDIAFFRPSTGEWLVLRSSSNFSTFFGYPFGANGDIPIVKKGA